MAYVHVHNLPVTFFPIHDGRDDDQCVLVDKVPYASLVSRRVAGVGEDVELERAGKGKEEREEYDQMCGRSWDHLELYLYGDFEARCRRLYKILRHRSWKFGILGSTRLKLLLRKVALPSPNAL